MPKLNPQSRPHLPRWLKRNVPKGNAGHFTAKLIDELGLETVCDHARCPNRMECYAQKTATFMILGDVCTRACRFCSVPKGRPRPVDPDEPRRVAEAAKQLGLWHVVITCVTRDDLPDGGAEHFCRTIEAVRRASSLATANQDARAIRRLHERMDLYRRERPIRDKAATQPTSRPSSVQG